MVSPLPEGEAGHAPLAPSDAYRWMACPGSIELRANLTPRPSGYAAERGTLMHSYAERCLKDEALFGLDPLHEDEHAIVDAFVTYVNAMTRDRDLDTAVGVETRVSLAELHPHVWGTVDTFVWFWRKGKRHLTIIDFKSGRMPSPGRGQSAAGHLRARRPGQAGRLARQPGGLTADRPAAPADHDRQRAATRRRGDAPVGRDRARQGHRGLQPQRRADTGQPLQVLRRRAQMPGVREPTLPSGPEG